MMAISTRLEAPFYQQFGFNVFRARRRKRLTVRMLADRAGVHPNTLARVEKGCPATVLTASKLADALGVGVAELIPKSQCIVSFQKFVRKSRRNAAKVNSGIQKLF